MTHGSDITKSPAWTGFPVRFALAHAIGSHINSTKLDATASKVYFDDFDLPRRSGHDPIDAAYEHMTKSVFCLNPPGDTPSRRGDFLPFLSLFESGRGLSSHSLTLLTHRILRRDSPRLHPGNLSKKLRPTPPLLARTRSLPLHDLHPRKRNNQLDRSLPHRPTRSNLARRNLTKTTSSHADFEETSVYDPDRFSAEESASIGVEVADVRGGRVWCAVIGIESD